MLPNNHATKTIIIQIFKDFKLVLVSFLHFVINRVELYLVLFQMGAFKYRKPEVGCQRNWILV